MIRPTELDSDRGRDVWDTIAAAAVGDVPALRRLLERDPELARSEYSPLRFAVREGHLESVRVLLDAGADPDLIGFSGDTLIEIASDHGYEAIATLLKEARDRRSRVAPAETHADHPIDPAGVGGSQ